MELFRGWLLLWGIVWLQAIPVRAFTQEVYVWQRQFSPAVLQSIQSLGGDATGIAVLAAEISWDKKRPRLFRSSMNFSRLAATARPVGLVLRIGPYGGRFAADDETARYLAGVAISVLNAARVGGLAPTELQVDFDCASSALAGYRLWLNALRLVAAPTKLTFTALPDWLGRADFPPLAHAVDGYILQVHSLEKPTGFDGVFQLCDPARAWTWIAAAAQIGAPFRVALPTYGYRLAFEGAGKFIALAAEGVAPVWPAGTRIRTVRADESSLAVLAAKIAAGRPMGCTGIIWFRLPVAGDQLNWDLATLKVFLRGGVPVSRLDLEVHWSTEGLAEVSVVNSGEQNERPPATALVRWLDDSRVLASDGLRGYAASLERENSGAIVLSAAPDLAEERIAPGHRRKIGWIRFSHETSLTPQIIVSP